VCHYYNDVKFVIAGKVRSLTIWSGRPRAWEWRTRSTSRIHKWRGTLKLYKCVDVAVFPSLYEPFGIVALEGMVANVPVVVSDTGGLGEIVEHGVDGMKSYTEIPIPLQTVYWKYFTIPIKRREWRKKRWRKFVQFIIGCGCGKTLNVYKTILEENKHIYWVPDYEGGNGKAQLTLQTEFFHDKGAGASFAGSFHVCCACRFF